MRENFKTDLPCAACGCFTENGNAFHHLKTQGAHSEYKEEIWNLIPVCKFHHTQFHQAGTLTMSAFYVGVKKWLNENGWTYNQFLKKWVHFDYTETT